MCFFGMDKAWQTNFATAVPKVLKLGELVEKSGNHSLQKWGVGPFKTVEKKSTFSRHPCNPKP
jgi:hypothetical protein